MIVDEKKFQGDKTKLTFENLIFPQRNFVSWWNLYLNMPDYLNNSCPVLTKGHESLRKPAALRCRFV